MHINTYERWWMAFGLAMLALFLATIGYAAIADNINPPSGRTAVDPTKLAQTPPFDHPGLHRLADGTYEAYYIAQVFMFNPQTLNVPVGAKVTFYVTSPDVVHGFYISKTDVNMMAVPGWVNTESHVFRHAGTYLLICHEYCGIGHQNMFGKIEVR
ncbi:MAG TPA: cytochrome c oxidase subunit II [Candidatus Baltobacteraceae bacterium]|jgi:cytochrome c oxidase subunit 2|nr:cytochrome c oxidase subunit II [Candidatus Baltobacteraceae bacterium]